MKKTITILFLFFALFSGCSTDIDYMEEPVAIDGFATQQIPDDSSMTLVCDLETLRKITPSDMTFLEKVDFSKINFSKNNLLLIHDVSNYGVHEIIKNHISSGNGFEFNINVRQNFLCVMQPWCIAYIMPKSLKQENIKYKISYTQ
ncbi:MAG: hypothetical protein J5965_05715 [Aeriscardovia sp.]|nr:hypothetical protein [Aeriscardovia sp.]